MKKVCDALTYIRLNVRKKDAKVGMPTSFRKVSVSHGVICIDCRRLTPLLLSRSIFTINLHDQFARLQNWSRATFFLCSKVKIQSRSRRD